ncbi:MAG: thioredoxin-dependent thiol peroxidase [Sphingobacteriales bacterium]|nr:thioredoxin-dependent thiol peroxidase [Sphingobacteriales bacterium]
MAALKVGSKAPAFKGKDQDGNSISLSDFKGKKLIVFFYPKDNTPGCTAEVCSLRDNYALLQKNGFELLGISVDDEKSHQKFITKHSLPFPLLADTDQKVVNAFGVWVEKSMYGRTYMGTARKTFIIDEEGKISNIIEKVDTKDHANQILNA